MLNNKLNRLASGRRIIHFCLFGWLSMFAFQLHSTPLLLPLLLALSGAAVAGSARVTGSLGVTGSVRFASVLGSIVPLLGLLVMGWLSSKARRELLTAGWRLGMFHAYRPAHDGNGIEAAVDSMG